SKDRRARQRSDGEYRRAPAAHSDDDATRGCAVRFTRQRRQDGARRSGARAQPSQDDRRRRRPQALHPLAYDVGTMPEEKKERLFIGVPLTDDARRAIEKSLPKKLPGKAVPAENWHFTLRFLGSTEADTRDKIVERLTAATCGASFT